MNPDKKNKTPKQSDAPVDKLHERLQDLADQAKVIENQADAEHRDMTAEELDEVSKLQAAFKETEKLIAAREANAEMQSKLRVPQPRITQPVDGPETPNAPTTFGSEGQASDGGFALPPDFREHIMKMVQGEESLLSRTDQQTTSSNSSRCPRTTPPRGRPRGGVHADVGR
jgi:HK97 family phage major capsid protein